MKGTYVNIFSVFILQLLAFTLAFKQNMETNTMFWLNFQLDAFSHTAYFKTSKTSGQHCFENNFPRNDFIESHFYIFVLYLSFMYIFE